MASIYKISRGLDAALSTTTLDIPQEIVDLIVAILSSEITTLRTCSELSIAFHVSARRFAFARVEIPLHVPEALARHMGKLRKTLKAKPHLLSEVASLKVLLPQFRPASEPAWKRMFSSANDDTRWVLQRIASSSHSARLTSLEICGTGMRRDDYGVGWDGISPFFEFNESIAPLVLSIAQTHPHLKSLIISSVRYVPISILNRMTCKPSIQYLSIVKTYFTNRGCGKVSAEQYLQNMRRLEVSTPVPSFLSHPTSALPKPEYISVAIPTCWYHLREAVEFLKEYTASLTMFRLALKLHSFNKESTSIILIPPSASLKTFRIDIT
ncbi:hypothetical protein BDN70DRAFT_877835 [Pholiota conissans]|uniref:Uncharacterized protein n=1 Tax=Pholiota conissans TaxID=109636 RepID=A0A9P5Z6B2_9AGAR|nr:hypothetical protein BDN70DRAFT_877835 [Pholiota conissans]